MGNEGYRDALLKMFHNPGGHWNPGRGPHPRYHFIFAAVFDINICVYLNLLKVLGKKKQTNKHILPSGGEINGDLQSV